MSRPQRTRPPATSPLDRPRLTPAVEPIVVGSSTDASPEPSPQTLGLTESRSLEVTESSALGVPRYLTLTRKEARLRGDQVDALAQLRRRLVARRVDRTEPLTDNTLIRVAVDLLLQRADQLAGDTEDQLRDSVTHRLPE